MDGFSTLLPAIPMYFYVLLNKALDILKDEIFPIFCSPVKVDQTLHVALIFNHQTDI